MTNLAVGIDLGTSNSAVAWVDHSGHTSMLRTIEGDIVTPSVVLFEDSEVIVGREAKRLAQHHPDRVAEWVKRDMGKPVYSRPIRGEYLPPEVIQACILRRLKADILRVVGPTARTVVTVPAYFDEPRRKATADAAEMAGLNVIDIVNEPTAAALGFGEVLGYLSPEGKPLQEMVVMVYDLGGGTFDATLLRLAPRDIRTLATDGDVELGGHDWDQRLVSYAAAGFQAAHGIDPSKDPAALSRLFAAAENAKHSLTVRNRTFIEVEHEGKTAEVQVSRVQFEELTADLMERTLTTSRQLLQAAGLQWSDVARLLLVGGSTRMPMVARRLQELTGLQPERSVNPDEAVARGAAVYAHYRLSREQKGKAAPLKVTNVNSHSLGIEGIDPQTLRKTNVVLIPRNSALPTKVAQKFSTKAEGQQSIVLQVLEGESSQPAACTAIGRTVIRDLPPGLPQGWPVEVTFEYAENGRLTVLGLVPGTHRQAVLDLERAVGLSNEGITRWKTTVGGPGGFDAFEAALKDELPMAGGGTATQPTPVMQAVPPQPAAPAPGRNPAAGPSRWDAGPAGAVAPQMVPAPEPLEPGSSPAWQPRARAPLPPIIEEPAEKSSLRKALSVAGIVVAGILGIVAAYMLVRWLFPGLLPPQG